MIFFQTVMVFADYLVDWWRTYGVKLRGTWAISGMDYTFSVWVQHSSCTVDV